MNLSTITCGGITHRGYLNIHQNGPHGEHKLTARCLNRIPGIPLAYMLCKRPQHWLEYRERAVEYPLTSQFSPLTSAKEITPHQTT